MRACPRHAHWLDGEPITDVLPMGGILDRHRSLDGNGAGPALGVLSVADAWACTNPSLGRGISLGLAHVALLRRVVREHADSPAELISAFATATESELLPWYASTVAIDRARLAEIDALRAGIKPTVPDVGPARIAAALPLAMRQDPDVFRGALEMVCCLTLARDVFGRPGFAERVLELAAGQTPPKLGPDREELLAVLR